MPRRIVFIADDFGMSASVNRAIVRGHTEGRLDGAALMMGQAGTDDAVRLAREHDRLQMGIHFHLIDSTPCTVEAWPWSRNLWRAGCSIAVRRSHRRRVRLELRRQWRLFRATGLACCFVNSHHHLHAHPFVQRALLDTIGPDFTGWIRLGDPRPFRASPLARARFWPARLAMSVRRRRCPLRSSDTLWGVDRYRRMTAPEVMRVVDALGEGLHEFLFHPRHDVDDPDTQCLVELRQLAAPDR